MRLHRLEVEGFGPFRARQVVDFDAFADDGIFLIAGRTGAGKSSILDAVCFGLYGGVPRYDGGEKRLRSDHSEPDDRSEVVVEFSTPAGRFRVTRSPEYLRPAKRGGGLTKQATAVALDEKTDAGWVGRAARAVDVAHELEVILQLSREQFLQVILLAQNRFSEFLLANSKDRQSLLRRLFGTERFEDVQRRFDERRRDSEQAIAVRIATIGARLDEAEKLVEAEGLGGTEHDPDPSDAGGADGEGAGPPRDAASHGNAASQRDAQAEVAARPTDTVSRLDALRRAVARSAYRVERRAAERDDAEAAHAAADRRLAAARDDRIAQQERDRARAALARLDSEHDAIVAAASELEQARSAEGLRGVLDAVSRATDAVTSAETALHTARERWQHVGSDTGLDGASAAELGEWVAERTRESGAWEHAARLEAEAPIRSAEFDAAHQAVADALRRIDDLARERGDLPEQIAQQTLARDDARRLADRLDEITLRRDQAIARAQAVTAADGLRDQYSAAERTLTEAREAAADAQSLLARLSRRRLDGYAGELASTLVEGEPCPVCGAHEHPLPAVHADPVSADDIAAAEEARDAAARRERAASDACGSLRERLAAAETTADGRDAESALVELDDIDAQRRAAVDAQREVTVIDERIAALTARAAALDEENAAAERSASAAREGLAAREQSAADAATLIAAAQGGFASVAERLETTAELIAAASALATAMREHDGRVSSLAEATTAYRSALDASPFDTSGDVERALRAPSDQVALDEKITRHTVQRETEKSILLPLELRGLPEQPIDLAPVESAAVQARAVWVAAVSAAGDAVGIHDRLDALVRAAADDHERSAEETSEHEVLQNLADTIAGRGPNTRKMTLETFVLAAELEEIVAAANRRLDDMSTGRYQLRHSDALAARGAASGLGIVVFDAFTGQTRPAQSLSGGETFLSSLALALGLAEVVTARAGGIRLDTLFIDEGFGSLDADTLDVAMRTLDELRQGGRTVGVISHVEAMQDQIPAQLRVRATSDGPSIIETR